MRALIKVGYAIDGTETYSVWLDPSEDPRDTRAFYAFDPDLGAWCRAYPETIHHTRRAAESTLRSER